MPASIPSFNESFHRVGYGMYKQSPRKWWLVLLILLVGIFPVSGMHASYQDYNIQGTGTFINFYPATGLFYLSGPDSSTGVIGLGSAGSEPWLLYSNNPPSAWTYAAFDAYGGGERDISGYDSNFNLLFTDSSPLGPGRIEIDIVGAQALVFVNGVKVYTSGILNTNPTYLGWNKNDETDNIVVGNSDPHVVGALPSNWTIQRDLINPASTGVYAWSNATSTWNLMNSNYFYIDADTSSQQTATTENFDIINYNSGTIVNTTTIYDQTSPRNQLQFNIANFLATSTSLGTQLPDGQYVAEFRGYPLSSSSFWVISNGATISWDKTSYPQNSNAVLTYSISNSYYQPTSYTYSMAIVNTVGTTLQTYSLTTQTGNEVLNLNSVTYPQGVYYAEILATPVGGGTSQIMNYAAATVTSYVYLSGYVMNAQTGLPLQNANVSTTQTYINSSALTSANGAYVISQPYLTGSPLVVTTNLTGYTNDVESFTPLGSGNINLNISLMPSPPTYSGVNIGGIVRDNQYGNVIPSATVSVYNTTTSESYSAITNIAGYYDVSGLTANRVYNVMSKATGYGNSSIYQDVAVGL